MDNPFHFTYVAIILWVGIYQGFLLVPILWFRDEGNQMANRLLAAFLLATSLRLLFSVYNFSQQTAYPNFFAIFSFPVSLLYGPFYYLYLKSYIEKSYKLRGRGYLHFLLPLLGFLFAILVSIFFDLGEKNLYLLARQRALPPLAFVVPLTVVFQVGIYMWLGLRLTLRYRNFVRSEASFSENRHIRWLVSLNLLLLLPVLSIVLILLAGGPRGDGSFLPIPAIGVSLMMVCIGVISLARPDFLQGLPEVLRIEKEEDLSPAPYLSSSLSAEKKDRYHQQLKNYLIEKEAFLDQDLTLSELSNRMGINTKYLSQIINEVEQTSFIDLINSHRIERAKELLIHPAYQYFTIIAIANEVGFKSKSAFYNAFKKFTKMTPSAYKNLKVKE